MILLAVLLSVLLFGASVPAAKVLLGGVDPVLLAGLLYFGSGLGLSVLFGVGRLTRLLPRQASLRRQELPVLATTVLIGGAIAPVLLMMGLRATSADSASLLLNLETLATLGIAWAGGREAPSRPTVTGAALILAGSLVLSWQGGGHVGWSALAIAGACLCWGIDNNLTGRLSAADPVQIALVKGLVAGGANLGLALLRHAALPHLGTVIAAGGVGFLGYGLSLVLFILGMRHLGVARASAYFATAPFIGALLAVAFLGEPVTLALAGAGLLMGVGMWLHLSEQHEHEHRHEALAHGHRHVHDEHHRHTHGPEDPPGEPHVHAHRHEPMTHRHRHLPDLHHRHRHKGGEARRGALPPSSHCDPAGV